MKLSVTIFGLLGAAVAEFQGFLYAIEDDECPSRTADNQITTIKWTGTDTCNDVDAFCDDRDRCAIGLDLAWTGGSQDPPYSSWRCTDSSCTDCDEEFIHQGGKAPSKGVLLDCAHMEGKQYLWIGG